MAESGVGSFITGLEWDAIPGDVIEQGKTCLLDYLACAFAGASSEASVAARRFAVTWAGGPQVPLIGTRQRMGLMGAAFCNGVAASDLDIDDGHRAALGHPGAAILPAATGLALVLESGSKELLTAVIIGYEVGIRAGEILYAQSKERFFGSGTWAAIGAAAACARLAGLTASQAVDAIGIAEAFAPLSPVMKCIAAGSMPKESLGWAAHTGVSSALLAREGFKGVTSILEEATGAAKWGEDYYIRRLYFKRYPCCRWTHPVLDAISQLLEERPTSWDEIKEVRVYTFEKAMSLANYRPKTTYHAQYSIPFTAALRLVRGGVTPADMSASNLDDERLLATAERVKLILDPERESAFPEKCTARVVIEKKDGTVVTSPVVQAKGDWDHPFTKAEMREKFLRLTEGIVSSERQQSLLSLVDDLEHQELRSVFDDEGVLLCPRRWLSR